MSSASPNHPPIRLSVVVASVESARTLSAALEALSRSCGSMTHEILVVDASRDRSAEIAECHKVAVRVLRHPPDTLVPKLWADGVRRSSGRWVALTTGHCVVPVGWADTMVGRLEEGASGVGAGLRPLPGLRALDYAVFFLRYGAFLEISRGVPRPVSEVPGDNAAYAGDAVRAFVKRTDRGFWELDYHREMMDLGGDLWAVPEATAGFGRSFPLRTILRHRFQHGRHHGAWRSGEGGQSRLRVVLPAPLVPWIFLARSVRCVGPFPELRFALARAVLPLLLLGTA